MEHDCHCAALEGGEACKQASQSGSGRPQDAQESAATSGVVRFVAWGGIVFRGSASYVYLFATRCGWRNCWHGQPFNLVLLLVSK